MQEHLRFTLFIIGIFIIGGILLHGMWTIRQNSKKNKRSSFESRNWEPDFEHEDDLEAEGPIFDDVGVSKARVIVNPDPPQKDNKPVVADNTEETENPIVAPISALDDDENMHVSQVTSSLSEAQSSDNEEENSVKIDENHLSVDNAETLNGEDARNDNHVKIAAEQLDTVSNDELDENEPAPVYSNVVTQPKPEYNKPGGKRESKDTEFGQPPEFLLKKDEEKREQQDNLSTNVSKLPPDTSVADGNEKPVEKLPEPDFSLNIQEGPIGHRSTDKPSAETLQGQEQSNDKVSSLKPGVEKELSFAEQAKRFVRRNKKTVADKIRKEPVLKNGPADDQMRIDFDESIVKLDPSGASDAASPNENAVNNAQQEKQTHNNTQNASSQTDVLVLNVRANNDKPIEGAALLPMLLTLGFKFGEHDIFHRHVNTNGKGPILFSLTNMFKPGVFDIDNLENFNTLGLSLFMMLPIEGDAQQVFNMMHNAARKLSDEFDCRILDGNKVGLSKQSLQQYVERIREFERKRLNR